MQPIHNQAICFRITSTLGLILYCLVCLSLTTSAQTAIPEVPTVEFASKRLQVREHAGTIQIPIRIQGTITDTTGPVLVRVESLTASAQPGEDFVNPSGELLRLHPGDTLVEYPFTIVDDTLTERMEVLVLYLELPVGEDLLPGETTELVLTLLDNERPFVAFPQPRIYVEETRGPVLIPLHVDYPLEETITVRIEAKDRSARAGQEYRLVTRRLEIPAGEQNPHIPVVLYDDDYLEDSLAFDLILTDVSAQAARHLRDTIRVVLLDDDFHPKVQFGLNCQPNPDIPEPCRADTLILETTNTADNSLKLPVLLSYPRADTVSLYYHTEDATALNRSDYLARAGWLHFAPGERFRTVSIPILNDELSEGTETFTVHLERISENAQLGYYRQFEVHIRDNESTTHRAELSLQDVQVFPNPTSDHVWVSGPEAQHLQVQILSTTGRTYTPEQAQSEQGLMIPLEHFPAGMYILQLTSPSGRQLTVPLMIQR